MSRLAPERSTAITGIGMSRISRDNDRSAMDLTLDACLEAVADAGLGIGDIDGVSTYPGLIADGSGMGPVGINELRMALGMELSWFSGAKETPGQLGSVFNAVAAICAGLANHVLVFRTINEASARRARKGATAAGGGAARVSGLHEWTSPYGSVSAAIWFALYAQKHFQEFGTRPEQLAQIAINARRNAMANPAAIYRTPLTLDDYMASRMIAEPLRLYDCDVPIDGSVAVVVSRADAARDLRNPPVTIEAIGSAIVRHDDRYRPYSLTHPAIADSAAMMWGRTDYKPKDVGTAQLYDGFSIHTMLWLEALGFCGLGESGPFVEGGARIARDGELPLNTSGGHLSGGRTHGLGFLHEACVQLWGRGGERQVHGRPATAIAAAGTTGGFSGCMLVSCGQ